tara:strand:+ start:1337 stop:1882 length:546 start_codon:yes stop_codon:yes gene_type:complete
MAVRYRGVKVTNPNAKVFDVGNVAYDEDRTVRLGASKQRNPAADQYKEYQTPSSNGSGERFYTRYDKENDTNYLYSATVTTRETTPDERRQNAIGRSGPYAGYDYVREWQYNRVGPAPGENPPGTRQPERAKQRNSSGDTTSSGGSYATRRNSAGRRSTILTGARGLLGNTGGTSKTLLGS